jgi:hypothetical protein
MDRAGIGYQQRDNCFLAACYADVEQLTKIAA